jgi:hypothetical protein
VSTEKLVAAEEMIQTTNLRNAVECLFLATPIVVVLFVFGMVDAEFGAREIKYGISLYLTLPLTSNQRIAVMGLFFTVLIAFVANRKRRTLPNGFLIVSVLYLSTLVFFEEIVYNEAMHPNGFTVFKFACKQEARMTVAEFTARYGCGREKYIDRAKQLLESCPNRPAVNSTSIERLLALPPEQGISRENSARIQIIGGEVFVSPAFDAATVHSDTSKLRLEAIVRDILSVLRECLLPDSEFVVQVGDGFDDRFWPVATPERDLYVPVFVQDMHRSAGR